MTVRQSFLFFEFLINSINRVLFINIINGALMFLIFVIAILIWFSTICVINLNRNVVAINDRHSQKTTFKQDKFFLKLPYPFQTVEQRISLDVTSINRYLQIGDIDFDFNCQYQIIDAKIAYFKLNDFEEYFLELLTNFIIQSFEKEIETKDEKEIFVRDKLTASLGRYGISILNLKFK